MTAASFYIETFIQRNIGGRMLALFKRRRSVIGSHSRKSEGATIKLRLHAVIEHYYQVGRWYNSRSLA